MARAHRAAQHGHPAKLLVLVEDSVAFDAALDFRSHAQRIGKSELVPARHSPGCHAIVQQLVGALQQRVDRVGKGTFLDGALGELGQVPGRGGRFEALAQVQPGMPDAGRRDDVEGSRAGEHELELSEGLDGAAQSAARPAHALGDGLELAVVRR